ncbi:hypothetical protein OIU78_028488 [Salix suchowensis]|nr:hypothetical protein OIU78_028488 [Salix suchowensis]
MAAASQASTLNQQALFEDQEGFIIPPSLAADAPTTTSLAETLPVLSSATHNKQREGTIASDLGGPHLLSLQRSHANLWAWGEVNECLNRKRSGTGEDHLGLSTIKMKKIKARRKVREPRFCFKTMSDVDVLDDGYKWRKYGQKVVKNTQHPRLYSLVQEISMDKYYARMSII